MSAVLLAETHAIPVAPARLDPIPLPLPLGAARVALGFPSPAEDFEDDTLDLNELLVRNPPATFFYRAQGHSMVLAGIADGDLLIIDRSVTPMDGDTVIATWEGNAPTCKVLRIFPDHLELHSRNPHVPNIVLPSHTEVEVFAVVGVVRQIKRCHARAPR